MRELNTSIAKLFAKPHTLQSIYTTTQELFGKRVFAEHMTQDGIEKMSVTQMGELTRRFASYAKRFLHSEYVGIYAKNSERWICTFWGLLMSGHIPVLLNTSIAPENMMAVVDDLGINEIIVDKPYAVFQERENIKAFLMENIEKEPFVEFEEDWKDNFVVSTSGTEGKQKSYLFNGEAMCEQILNSKDILDHNHVFSCYSRKNAIKLLAFLPFYHIFGLVTLVLWFSFFGRTLVFPMDDTPKEMQRACKTAKVTHIFAVPVVWNTLVKKIEEEVARQGATEKFKKAVDKSIDLQKIFPRLGRYVANRVIFKEITDKLFGKTVLACITGGAHISSDVLKVVNALGYNLFNGYGSTEAGIVSVNMSTHIGDRIKTHCGRVFNSIVYRVDKETGELQLNGHTLYFAKWVDGAWRERNDQYVNTRDIATVSGKRELTLIGRLDEMLIGPNGENLSPDFIEMYYGEINADDYCVLSWQSKLVLVINKNSVNGTRSELQTSIINANKSVPTIERIHEVRLIDYPCRTIIGKANRKEILEGFIDGSLKYETLMTEARTHSSSVESAVIREAISKILAIDVNNIDDKDDFFLNLGGNSLQYFELMSQLSEEFDVEIQFIEELPTTVSDIEQTLEKLNKK